MYMAARIPVRFERVAAAFDADVARVRLCESSGSEHSPESSSTDLSDLVKSFVEKQNEIRGAEEDREKQQGEQAGVEEDDDLDENLEWADSEKREMLRGLFAGSEADDDDDDDRNAKENVRREAEVAAWGLLGANSSASPAGFKRRFMSSLRERGLDAGLCKSKWEKNRSFPGGDYEYVDVNFDGKRYIVEVSLAAEFEIARPTNRYSSMLDVFPPVFVGKVEELKRVVRLMCTAIKGSMKSMDLHVPPWRRNGYMQAKWFSCYKRTTNEVATRKALYPLSLNAFTTQRSIGFEARSMKNPYNCREDYGRKAVFRVGHLTAAFDADGFGMRMQS